MVLLEEILYKFGVLGVYMDGLVNEKTSRAEPSWCQRLYETKASELILYGRALGLSHSEAEDVLQETFLALLGRAEAPREPDHYCVRAYRNRALHYRRGLWRRLRREWESHRWFEQAPDETARERAAMDALARLPDEQREVIVLKLWHGYTFNVIGELLAVSPHTVAGRYRYGLQKMRASLAETNVYETSASWEESLGSLGPAVT